MKTTEILKRVLVELTKRVKLEQQTLENGTIIEADSFAVGNEIFIVSGEDRIALPVGEYTLADGSVLYVTEEGIIGELATPSTEDVQPVAAQDEEVVIEAPAEVAPAVEDIVQAVVDVVAPMIEEIKTEMAKMREEYSSKKQDMSKTAAAKPFKRNPEVAKPEGLNMASQRSNNTLDRVLSKLK